MIKHVIPVLKTKGKCTFENKKIKLLSCDISITKFLIQVGYMRSNNNSLKKGDMLHFFSIKHILVFDNHY